MLQRLSSYLSLLFLIGVSPASAETEIQIGWIAPLTGDAANYGRDERDTVTMALEDLNAQKSLPPIRAIFEDGKCTGKEAASAARKLIDTDHVQVILGGMCSGETLGAAPIAEGAKVLLLSAYSSSPKVTEAGDYIFRVAPSDSESARKAAELVMQSGSKRSAIISTNTEYATHFRDVFIEALKPTSTQVVANETFNAGDTDLRSLLLRMKDKDPDSLLVNPQSGAQAGLIIKQARELHWKSPLIGTFALSSGDAQNAAGGVQNLEGIRFVDVPMMRSKASQDFLKRFQTRYGRAPQSEFDTVLRYDTVFVLAQAIKAVGYNGTAIKNYLYGLPGYQGLEFNLRFDKNGDVVGVPWVIKRYQDGRMLQE